jgi:N-acetylglucosaminyldiphosphoundecaprenol N-acetyl-beta-D-mannosaminyltransferase
MTLSAKSSETTTILGVQISLLGFEQVLKNCLQRAATSSGGYVCFANVHSVIESHWSSEVRKALNEAYLSVADGMPLVWTSKLSERPIQSRVCGPDMMKAFLGQSRDSVQGMIGGPPGQAEALAGKLGLKALCYSPPMRPFSPENAREDWLRFLEMCPEGKPPAVVWVGLGAPKQELWMRVVSSLAPNTLFFGVGAAFDFLAGNKSRAPVWMQENGLEWLYRLTQEPKRLWRRYFYTNSLFIWLLARQAFLSLAFSIVGVLTIQLFLSWFSPPIALGKRSLFLGDLWFFIWVPFLLIQQMRKFELRRKLFPWLFASLCVAVVCWEHGAYRPPLAPQLQVLSIELPEGDAFSPVREAAIAFRFLIWFWSGVALAHQPFSKREIRWQSWGLVWGMGLAALAMVACKLSLPVAVLMGRTFGYVPETYPWIGRVYGVFRSPNEAGISLGLGALLVAGCVHLSRSTRALIVVAGIAGVGFAKAATSFVGMLLSAIGGYFSRWPRLAAGILFSAIGTILAGLPILSHYSDLVENKLANLIYRFGPWKIYFWEALSKWDRLIFGTGFNQYNVDNCYLFLLNRGGLLLFGGMIFTCYYVIRRSWNAWNAYQRAVLLFLILTSFTLDALILRPLVAVLICGIPLLKVKGSEAVER